MRCTAAELTAAEHALNQLALNHKLDAGICEQRFHDGKFGSVMR